MTFWRVLLVLAALCAAGIVGWLNRGRWLPRASISNEPAAGAPKAPAPPPNSVALTDQTVKTLGLVSKPVRIGSTWRTLTVPGTVVDRPGVSDRGVSAPMSAVVLRVHVAPGDVVRPGDPLFTLRVVGEALQAAQAELFKASEERKVVADQLERLRPLSQDGAVSGARLVELDGQSKRLAALIQSSRHDLAARGLSASQIEDVERGRFVTEFVVGVPQTPKPSSEADAAPPMLQVQEIRTELGQQVQSGQILADLSDHRFLAIEGRAFKHEASLIEAAARNDWPVAVEFLGASDLEWSQAATSLPIATLGSNVDPVSRTFPFTMALANQFRTIKIGDRSLVVWRYRTGQKVRLSVPAAKLDDAIVLPPDAVARDGSERVVFRHNGSVFERKSVQVLLEERDRVVLANDGSLSAGVYVVQNQATALLRALKAQAPKPEVEGGHWHADGSFHAAPKEEGE